MNSKGGSAEHDSDERGMITVKRLVLTAAVALLATFLAYQSMTIGRFIYGETRARLYRALPRTWTSTWSSGTMDARLYEDDLDHLTQEHHLHDPPQPTSRTTWGSRGAMVRGWPSTGGLYIATPCYGVELDFLGLDRFHESPRSEDPAEEDAFCKRLRMIGASWFANEREYAEADLRGYGPNAPRPLVLGWPEGGGVWVLRVNEREAVERGLGRIQNAYNMEERCRVIEQLGGTYFADPKDCPDTRDLV